MFTMNKEEGCVTVHQSIRTLYMIRSDSMRILKTFLLSTPLMISFFSGCSTPQPGPDKTLIGAAMGAAWGAGAGAVVGHQVSASGEGAAVGAGIGALSGAMTGAGYDVTESQHIAISEHLDHLEAQNTANAHNLLELQKRLDYSTTPFRKGVLHKVFFDPEVTSLRAGAIGELEPLAEQLRKTPGIRHIKLRGHSDDAGTPDYNVRISEARARSVLAFLMSKGISSTRISMEAVGSSMPVASNVLPEGRQQNRRVDIIVE